MKPRFLVRRLEQAVPKSACVCFESFHFLYEAACDAFDIYSFISNMKAIFGEKVSIQLIIT